MTCREKLKELKPDFDQSDLNDFVNTRCPVDHMDIEVPSFENGMLWCGHSMCEKCWDREIPGTEPLTYKHASEPIGKVTEIIEDENGVTVKIEPTNSHYIQNEKEKNMATKKTKTELMEELETIKEAKAELEKELKNLEKYKQYEDCADETKAIHTAFVNSGFSDAQAFELVKMFISTAMSQQFTKAVLRR